MATYTITKPIEQYGTLKDCSPTWSRRIQDFHELLQVYFVAVFDFLSVLPGTILEHRIPILAKLRSKALAQYLARPWPLIGGTASAEAFLAFQPLLANLKGAILEIGPGSGQMLQYYTPRHVHAMYVAEPCEGIYPVLLASAEHAGLREKFTALHCGGERSTLEPALRKAGVHTTGVFDAIVCSKVLCAVPEPQDTVEFMYQLLKPGGRIVLREHVQNETNWVANWAQRIFMWMGWSFFVGECHLDRPTVRIVEAAACKDGGWAENNVVCTSNWAFVPFVVGELVKK